MSMLRGPEINAEGGFGGNALLLALERWVTRYPGSLAS